MYRKTAKITEIELLLLLLCGWHIGGCVSQSIASDVDRVRALTRVEHVAGIVDDDVDPNTAKDLQKLLAQPIDVNTAVRVALLNNRELRATFRSMGIVRGRLIQAGLLPNPVVEAELLPERETKLELRVEYDITRLLLAPLHARAAEPELKAAHYRTSAAVIELAYRVRVAFYRLQSVEQKLALAQQMLDTMAASRDAAQALFKAGNIAALNLAAEEVAYEKARVAVAKFELERADERESLQRLFGTHGHHTHWQIRGFLVSAPKHTDDTMLTELETRALQANFGLLATRQQLEGLARRTSLARNFGWLPDVTLDVHGLNGHPDETGSNALDRDWRFGGGISVGLPLFDRQQGTATALESEFDVLMERFYGLAVDLRSMAREARNRLSSAYARAIQYQTVIVPAQSRVLEQTLLQYNAMQLGIFDLLAARNEQLTVELAYIETLREYWSARAELEALLAGHINVAPQKSAPAVINLESRLQGEH